jgi:CheY-like chemotaxis protein
LQHDNTTQAAVASRVHIEKMQAVSRVAGGMSHDLGDLVDLAVATIREAMFTDCSSLTTRRHLEEATASLTRASLIARQLETLARTSPARPEVRPVGRAVSDLVPLVERLAGDAVEVNAERLDLSTWVEADPGQIEQVVFHLTVNARDAMPAGGQLTLIVESREVTSPRVHRYGVIKPGSWVVLEVGDTGEGMSESVLDQLFEPFFTTKAPGLGSGLGLATVWGISQQLGGQVAVESELGAGTTVTLWLPAATPRTPVDPDVSGEGVLVVDDDEWVRAVTTRSLRRAGYGVLEAGDAESALEILGDVAGSHVSVVLTDVAMPGMSGLSLAEMIASSFPELRVVLMTGQAVEYDFGGKELPLLRKPFTRRELLAAVAGVEGSRIILATGSGMARPGGSD